MEIVEIVALAIFAVTFFFILTERIHRTVIGLFGAMTMLLAGMYFDFYHPENMLEVVDFNTLGLLFGMMLLVACSSIPAPSSTSVSGPLKKPKETLGS